MVKVFQKESISKDRGWLWAAAFGHCCGCSECLQGIMSHRLHRSVGSRVFPFREDSGMGWQTTRGLFTDSHVVSVSGNEMDFHHFMAVMLVKLATTHRI
jgi:hypothetical protein